MHKHWGVSDVFRVNDIQWILSADIFSTDMCPWQSVIQYLRGPGYCILVRDYCRLTISQGRFVYTVVAFGKNICPVHAFNLSHARQSIHKCMRYTHTHQGRMRHIYTCILRLSLLQIMTCLLFGAKLLRKPNTDLLSIVRTVRATYSVQCKSKHNMNDDDLRNRRWVCRNCLCKY